MSKEAQYKSLVLELKLVKSRLDEAKSVCEEGKQDLRYRIVEAEQFIAQKQREAYRSRFFPKVNTGGSSSGSERVNQDDTGTNSDSTDVDNVDDSLDDTSRQSSSVRSDAVWQKKLLRKVAVKTHPDKISSYDQEDKDFLVDIYKKSQDAYNNADDGYLMVYANEVRVRPPVIQNVHLNTLKTDIRDGAVEAKRLTQSHDFIWYHLNEKQKVTFLKNYFRQLGFELTDKEAAEIVKRVKPDRKVGTRPAMNVAMRRRIKERAKT